MANCQEIECVNVQSAICLHCHLHLCVTHIVAHGTILLKEGDKICEQINELTEQLNVYLQQIHRSREEATEKLNVWRQNQIDKIEQKYAEKFQVIEFRKDHLTELESQLIQRLTEDAIQPLKYMQTKQNASSENLKTIREIITNIARDSTQFDLCLKDPLSQTSSSLPVSTSMMNNSYLLQLNSSSQQYSSTKTQYFVNSSTNSSDIQLLNNTQSTLNQPASTAAYTASTNQAAATAMKTIISSSLTSTTLTPTIATTGSASTTSKPVVTSTASTSAIPEPTSLKPTPTISASTIPKSIPTTTVSTSIAPTHIVTATISVPALPKPMPTVTTASSTTVEPTPTASASTIVKSTPTASASTTLKPTPTASASSISQPTTSKPTVTPTSTTVEPTPTASTSTTLKPTQTASASTISQPTTSKPTVTSTSTISKPTTAGTASALPTSFQKQTVAAATSRTTIKRPPTNGCWRLIGMFQDVSGYSDRMVEEFIVKNLYRVVHVNNMMVLMLSLLEAWHLSKPSTGIDSNVLIHYIKIIKKYIQGSEHQLTVIAATQVFLTFYKYGDKTTTNLMTGLLRFFFKYQCITKETILDWYKNGAHYGYTGYAKAKQCAKPFIDELNTNIESK